MSICIFFLILSPSIPLSVPNLDSLAIVSYSENIFQNGVLNPMFKSLSQCYLMFQNHLIYNLQNTHVMKYEYYPMEVRNVNKSGFPQLDYKLCEGFWHCCVKSIQSEYYKWDFCGKVAVKDPWVCRERYTKFLHKNSGRSLKEVIFGC